MTQTLGLYFDDGVLREMGRFHSGDDARRAVAWARAAGFASISVDLILGWPGETAAGWRLNLDTLAALAPDHVSLYVLAESFEAGLSEIAGEHLRLTEKGVLLSNEVFRAFV